MKLGTIEEGAVLRVVGEAKFVDYTHILGDDDHKIKVSITSGPVREKNQAKVFVLSGKQWNFLDKLHPESMNTQHGLAARVLNYTDAIHFQADWCKLVVKAIGLLDEDKILRDALYSSSEREMVTTPAANESPLRDALQVAIGRAEMALDAMKRAATDIGALMANPNLKDMPHIVVVDALAKIQSDLDTLTVSEYVKDDLESCKETLAEYDQHDESGPQSLPGQTNDPREAKPDTSGIPVLYELDENGEGTGTVYRFCDDGCADQFDMERFPVMDQLTRSSWGREDGPGMDEEACTQCGEIIPDPTGGPAPR